MRAGRTEGTIGDRIATWGAVKGSISIINKEVEQRSKRSIGKKKTGLVKRIKSWPTMSAQELTLTAKEKWYAK